jgi:para-nitrobenzyl esterase
MRLSRREILARGPFALACTAAVQRQACGQAEEPQYVEAKTAYGRVRGLQAERLVTFKGIPYAGSVSGANRFKAAPPLKSWTGVRDALKLGPPAIQPGQRRK